MRSDGVNVMGQASKSRVRDQESPSFKIPSKIIINKFVMPHMKNRRSAD